MQLKSLSHKKIFIHFFPRSIKFLLFFVGLITFLLIMFKGFAIVPPSSYDIVISNLKKPWFLLRQWLSSPLFVCFIINFIVILIAATSKIQNNNFQENHDNYHVPSHDDFQMALPPPPSPLPPPLVVQQIHQNRLPETPFDRKLNGIHPNAMKIEESTLKAASFSFKTHMGSHQIDQDEIFSNQNCCTEGIMKARKPMDTESVKKYMGPHQIDQDEFFSTQNYCTEGIMKAQKPIDTESVKKSQSKSKVFENDREKTGLKTTNIVETDDDDNTMDATWEAITKSKKKDSTFAQQLGRNFGEEKTEEIDSSEGQLPPKSGSAKKELRKSSMSFNETVSLRFRGGMMRGPSISLEELHGRVEAHIKNFNKEMRLQRQESEQRYLETLNRNI